MPPASCEALARLSPCPLWPKPLPPVGLPSMTTVQQCVWVPSPLPRCSTGCPGEGSVTACQARLTTWMVSRRDGAWASRRPLEERHGTSTSPTLSRRAVSTSHPRPLDRFERTDRRFPLYQAFPDSEYYGHADLLLGHRRFCACFRSHLHSPSFTFLGDSPEFIARDSATYFRWWFPDNLYRTPAAPDRRGGMQVGPSQNFSGHFG
jgi:hypothetical protein